MKIKITVSSKKENAKLKLFGTKFNYQNVNYGNSININFEKVEVDEDYINKLGDIIYPESGGFYSAFLMDCIKYNLSITKVNGKPLVKKEWIEGELKYIEIERINPYTDIYIIEIPIGISTFEFEVEVNNTSFYENNKNTHSTIKTGRSIDDITKKATEEIMSTILGRKFIPEVDAAHALAVAYMLKKYASDMNSNNK